METLRSERVHGNPFFAVREDAVRRADGSTGAYYVVETPDIAVIIPLDEAGDRFHLVEQFRQPLGARLWEFPAGTLDVGLDGDPAELAARELREETGLSAQHLDLLGTLAISPGTLTQRCSVFLATGLTEGRPQREIEEQDMVSAWFTRGEVEQMIAEGTMTDAKSLAAYTLLSLTRA